MSDLGIFMFGCGVFGLTLAATMASIIGTSQAGDELDKSAGDAELEPVVHELPAATGGNFRKRKVG